MIPDLMDLGAVDALFLVATKDPSLNAQRVALFSIGNFCVYPECKTFILGNENYVSALKKITKSLETASDKTYVKYAKRLLQRIN